MDGVGVTLVSAGGLLIYAGMKGFSVPDLVTNLIVGRPIAEGVLPHNPLATQTPQVTPQEVPGSSGTMRSAASGIANANQNLGNSIARQKGWDEGEQWDALVELWTRESNWDNRAQNASSGAYGIPQALPYTKMPKIAWPESAGGQSDPAAQIEWGLNYIAGRYGVPQFALAYHKQNGWY